MMFLTGIMLSFYPSPVSPKGEKPMPPETKIALVRKITTAITRPAPFPFGKGGDRSHHHLLSILFPIFRS
jgi:hypothetical protein